MVALCVFFFSYLDFHTISTTQALLLPLGASCSLLFMFFFFEKIQLLFAVLTVGRYLYLFFSIITNGWNHGYSRSKTREGDYISTSPLILKDLSDASLCM